MNGRAPVDTTASEICGREICSEAPLLRRWDLCFLFWLVIAGAATVCAAASPEPEIVRSWSLATVGAETEQPSTPTGLPATVSGPELPGWVSGNHSSLGADAPRSGWSSCNAPLPAFTTAARWGHPDQWSARGPPSSAR